MALLSLSTVGWHGDYIMKRRRELWFPVKICLDHALYSTEHFVYLLTKLFIISRGWHFCETCCISISITYKPVVGEGLIGGCRRVWPGNTLGSRRRGDILPHAGLLCHGSRNKVSGRTIVTRLSATKLMTNLLERDLLTRGKVTAGFVPDQRAHVDLWAT